MRRDVSMTAARPGSPTSNAIASSSRITASRLPPPPPDFPWGTVTLTDRVAHPPPPVHRRVNVVSAVRGALVNTPLVGWEPLKPPAAGVAVQLVAFCVDQLRSTVE